MKYSKLERQKLRRASCRWAVLGIYAALLLMGIVFLCIPKLEGGAGVGDEVMFFTWSGLLSLTTALSFACFSIFSAALAAKLIVQEYRGRGAGLLLSYPVERRTILGAKCGVLCLETAVPGAVCNAAAVGGMYLAAQLFQDPPQMDINGFLPVVLGVSLLEGILSAAAGILAALVGWKRNSSVAAVVAALLLVCCTANVIPFAPRHVLLVMLGMGAVFVPAALALYRILVRGIEGMEV